jgi:hypothetical protein
MASVVFGFGRRPGIPGDDALELADLLARTRTLAGNSAAEKIRRQARRDPDRGEKSEDIGLGGAELRVLANVLRDEPWTHQQPWYSHLQDELAATQGAGAN